MVDAIKNKDELVGIDNPTIWWNIAQIDGRILRKYRHVYHPTKTAVTNEVKEIIMSTKSNIEALSEAGLLEVS